MPYENERASKTAHGDFVKNPDIQAFLNTCEYLTPPGEAQTEELTSVFSPPPRLPQPSHIELVLATDGSNYESALHDQIPSTRLGYLKVGAVLFSLKEFSQLREGRFIDPFKVAALQDNNTALSFVLPSANVRLAGKTSVRDSFRAALDEQLLSEKTRFDPKNFYTSLRSTLFHLASRRPGDLGTGNPFKLKLHKCPTCETGPVEVEDKLGEQTCPHCGAPVYPSDCLRIWEEVTEYQSNQVPLSRLMMVLEHLIPLHYIRFIEQKALLSLNKIAFFVDGPLAVYGTPAWLHRSIMIYLHEVNSKLAKHHQPPLLIIGLQKTGQIVDYMRLMDRFLPPNRLFAIDDEYRYKYILANREASKGGFGFETYYGQDFIFKTSQGRTFVFALPYPYPSKDEPGSDFLREKTEWSRYPTLPTAIQLLEDLQTELYRDALVPIALAHRYTAISLQPGGRVLDLLTRRALA
ncbi:MAG: DNA double-strand break repair nuclease NurA [Anaerolineales bacterium]|nr:DNA double-strand break repair nuclease NurA [Anaerolineales bacterium]MCX7754805.1 DNA double-strand break repair nuclease NurA [Anaerolineales bacterium]MDW8277986.1 DNA double-strand break repair nuclease NurA [Anaerolineales bacterium]